MTIRLIIGKDVHILIVMMTRTPLETNGEGKELTGTFLPSLFSVLIDFNYLKMLCWLIIFSYEYRGGRHKRSKSRSGSRSYSSRKRHRRDRHYRRRGDSKYSSHSSRRHYDKSESNRRSHRRQDDSVSIHASHHPSTCLEPVNLIILWDR